MHILLVAPCAPPKNSAEAIQVGRLMRALDPDVEITLVTTPAVAGWEPFDETLRVRRKNIRVVHAALPFHSISHRLLTNHRLARLHVPDSDFWLPRSARGIVRRIPSRPDIVYSRSYPLSAALLARALKTRLGLPWLMHLSDPWTGGPNRLLPRGDMREDDERLAKACFGEADSVAFTTAGQAAYYADRYPFIKDKLFVSPNMLPIETPKTVAVDGRSHPVVITYTGSFYGERNPSVLLAAMRMIESNVETAGRIRMEFCGNMSPEIAAAIVSTLGCVWRGPVSYDSARAAQYASDVLLTVEWSAGHPLNLAILFTKVVDYLAVGKPILALTARGSETDRLCRAGHGWSFDLDDVQGVARLLRDLAVSPEALPSFLAHDVSNSPYRASEVAEDVLARLRRLSAEAGG